MIATIDPGAGFCFGVRRVIELADQKLDEGSQLTCIGQILHNQQERERLYRKGMAETNHDQLPLLQEGELLIRAHGEPPETFQLLSRKSFAIIDGTCPVVKRLQKTIQNIAGRIRNSNEKACLLIAGKKNHPEIIGLLGYSGQQAIVIEKPDEVDHVKLSDKIYLLAQTTIDETLFEEIQQRLCNRLIQEGKDPAKTLQVTNSICRSVKNRKRQIEQFASAHDVVIFVGDQHSSNSRYLFNVCKIANPRSYFVENKEMVDPSWFAGYRSVGITGGTSTPLWLLSDIQQHINHLTENPPLCTSND